MYSPESLRIEQAEQGQDNLVAGLFLRGAKRAKELLGDDQWKEELLPTLAAAYVERGEAFIVYGEGDEAIGTAIIKDGRPANWGSQGPESAIYLSKMTVMPEYSGLQTGTKILDWATSQAREAGREFLILDVVTENDQLRKYYTDQGFEQVGQLGESDDGRKAITLYQRSVEFIVE